MVVFVVMRSLSLASLLLVLLTACGASDEGSADTAGGGGDAGSAGSQDGCACSSYGYSEGDEPPTVTAPAITELSGLAASWTHPGVLYAHNDSGDDARLFALSLSGELLATFTLDGIKPVDWEDIAVGPCPEGSCIFIGDVGDNLESRSDYNIIRVVEPELPSTLGAEVSVPFDRIELHYGDGKHYNCEAIMVHPMSGDMYLVAKTLAATNPVFRVAQNELIPGAHLKATADFVAAPEFPGVVTAADIHPCGDRLLLRTYAEVLELVASGPFETAFLGEVVKKFVPPFEKQGEALAYLRDGTSVVTGSEAIPPFPLHIARCLDEPQ